jgi:hypothetical protein
LTLRISLWSRVAIKCSMLWWAVKPIPSYTSLRDNS